MGEEQYLMDGPIDRAEYERRIREAADRALKEAEERRRRAQGRQEKRPREIGGPEGPEPTRYGDWERKGIVSDF